MFLRFLTVIFFSTLSTASVAREQEDALMKASTATESEKCLKCMDLVVDCGVHGAAFDSTVQASRG